MIMDWNNRWVSFDDIERQMEGFERYSRDEKIDTFCNKQVELRSLIATFLGTKWIKPIGTPYQLTPIITKMVNEIVEQWDTLTPEQEKKISQKIKEAKVRIWILKEDLDKLASELKPDYDEYIKVLGPKTRWKTSKLLELKHAMEKYYKI